jgi:cytochrome c2
MKRAFIIMLVAMLSLSAAAWAQTDPLLGPHNVAEKGCRACHAPHNGAVMNGGTDKSTGEVYLWGRDFKAQTYYTFGGGSFTTVANPTETDPVVHTQMCMSCHDGGISDATMSSEAQLPNDGYSLQNDHPVNVEYKPATSTSAYNWNITITSGRASFADTTWVGGHPARLYVDAAGTKAYVECSTCHNPHSFNRAVFKIGGVTTVKTSSRFVRGWYDPADGKSKADFCRSCHLSKSTAYDGAIH